MDFRCIFASKRTRYPITIQSNLTQPFSDRKKLFIDAARIEIVVTSRLTGKTIRHSHLDGSDAGLALRQPEVVAAEALGADELVQSSKQDRVVQRHGQLWFGEQNDDGTGVSGPTRALVGF